MTLLTNAADLDETYLFDSTPTQTFPNGKVFGGIFIAGTTPPADTRYGWMDTTGGTSAVPKYYDPIASTWTAWSGTPGGATTLAALTDVLIGSPVDGAPLVWDSGSSKWVNAPSAALLASQVGVANGVAGLDADGRVPIAQLPALVSGVVSGCAVAYSGAGWVFNVGGGVVGVNGAYYVFAGGVVTLDPADPTDDRIDAIVIDVATGAAVATNVTGAPTGAPVAPNITATQVELDVVPVPAASTAPAGVTLTTIYDDGLTGEWDTITVSPTVSPTFDATDTSDPNTGSDDTAATLAVTNDFVRYGTGVPVGLQAQRTLTLWIKSLGAWDPTRCIKIYFAHGTARVGNYVKIYNGTNGFDSTFTSGYQKLLIDITSFATGSNLVDGLKVQIDGTGAALSFLLDSITLESGTVISASGTLTVTDGTNTVTGALTLKFTSGATVTATGTEADVAITGGGGGGATISTSTPAAETVGNAGTAGTSTEVSASDHVHPFPSAADLTTALASSFDAAGAAATAQTNAEAYADGIAGITALTGDVTASGSGSVPASVVGLQGKAVSNAAPATNQALVWNGTAWVPTTLSTGAFLGLTWQGTRRS
jgi:hypothetical protein